MAKMKHLKREERYQEVELIKDPLLKQFEYFRLNLKDVEEINLVSSWPREHQEDLRDLLDDIPRLKSFERFWWWRKKIKFVFTVYLYSARASITKTSIKR